MASSTPQLVSLCLFSFYYTYVFSLQRRLNATIRNTIEFIKHLREKTTNSTDCTSRTHARFSVLLLIFLFFFLFLYFILRGWGMFLLLCFPSLFTVMALSSALCSTIRVYHRRRALITYSDSQICSRIENIKRICAVSFTISKHKRAMQVVIV